MIQPALDASAQLALTTIEQRPTPGIPTAWLNIMEHAYLERLARAPAGAYRAEPERIYIAAQRAAGVCLLDQYIPSNPLTMGDQGFESDAARTATTGAAQIVRDGLVIDSPEAALAHLERVAHPNLRERIAQFDEDALVQRILAEERAVQERLGPSILKAPYGVAAFPYFHYNEYGYENYFLAYALYPEVMEQDFALQAEYARLHNKAVARAYVEGQLPPLLRLDHDMADSKGTLVDIRSLDRLWFPHFVASIEPLLQANIRLLWHCDGNLMAMAPRLLEAGLSGFQGFQYEDGMDYEAICRMKTRDGRSLIIMAGVSVSRTLPFGTPAEVKRELDWLVEKGPRTGLFLGCSSSLTPGVPWANVATLLEGLAHYRTHGRER